MPIKAKCANCESTYTLADTTLGKTVKCRECGEGFLVKRSRAEGGESLRAGPPPREPAPAPRRRPKETNPDDEDDRPRRKKNREPEPKKGGGLMWWLIGGGAAVFLLLLVGGGIVVAVFMFGNKATPENFAKIRQGMTEKEVIDIMGRPSDGLGFNNAFTKIAGIKNLPNVKALFWRGRGETIYEVMLEDGKVVAAVGNDGQFLFGGGFGEQDPFAGFNQPPANNPVFNKPPINQPVNNPPANLAPVIEAFKRVRQRMSEAEVIGLLGQPTNTTVLGDARVLNWDTPKGDKVMITFRNNQIANGGAFPSGGTPINLSLAP
jgi:DNA-directed RNA polymerase subunit RPC12/RpoP